MLFDKLKREDNMKKLVLGGVSAALLASSSGAAYATTTINVAVAANFYGVSFPTTSALGEIISAFVTANPSYSVAVVDHGSTGTLVNHITTGNSLGVDLLLAADESHVVDLYNNYPTLVAGIPFAYAVGTLAFWSNTSSVNVSCSGTGATCGYNTTSFGNSGDVVIADPANAPYGLAAKQLLTGRYGVSASSIPSASIATSATIDTTYNAIKNLTYKAGFIALSSVCSNGSYPNQGTVYVYPATEYKPSDATSTSPVASTYDYATIIQDGIKIAHTRTADQDTELTAFIAFLRDYSSSTTAAVATLKKYCYQVP